MRWKWVWVGWDSFADDSLSCDGEQSLVCMNGGVCVDFGKIGRFRFRGGVQGHQSCICSFGFYGPHCEYVESQDY